MASFFNKTKLNTAVDSFTELDLSCQHITTSNFMDVNIAHTIELVPKQSIDVHQLTFARLEPLPVPTFGRARIHNRAFFVPYRTVFPAWNDFITDTSHTFSNGSQGLVTSVPLISNLRFLQFLTSAANSTLTDDDDTTFDFNIVGSVPGITSGKYYLTHRGQLCFKLLLSLGYKFDFNVSHEDFNSSALPLLCFAKVYADWYFPSSYAYDTRFAAVSKWFKYDSSNYATAITPQDIDDIFNVVILSNYDDDYFTSAWDNPVNPNDGSSSKFSLVDITNSNNPNSTYNSRVVSGTSGVSNSLGEFVGSANAPKLVSGNVDTLTGSASPLGVISQYALDALRSLTDYMKRHQIVGARALDRYLARWGVTLSAEKLNRCLYLGDYKQDIEFGDVMSTSDTDGANLGSYAGKGLSIGDGNISFQTDEYGMLIIVSTIIPEVGYYQGQSRHTMHISKLDFYTPEFDSLGTQPISAREVYMPFDGSKTTEAGEDHAESTSYDDVIFGFLPRYAEYKTSRDMITGDYVLGSRNVGKDSWTLYRDLDDFFANKDTSEIKHSYSFICGLDRNQYNRIFYNTNATYDKFNIIHNFTIKSRFPGKSLFDTYRFENQGDVVTTDTNGVKVN